MELCDELVATSAVFLRDRSASEPGLRAICAIPNSSGAQK